MEIDPLALKVIQDTNPNFNPDKLGDYSSEELVGIVNSAKDKLSNEIRSVACLALIHKAGFGSAR